MSSAFGDKTLSVSHQNCLYFNIYLCTWSNILLLLSSGKAGSKKVNDVGKLFELKINRLKVHVCLLDSFCSGKC